MLDARVLATDIQGRVEAHTGYAMPVITAEIWYVVSLAIIAHFRAFAELNVTGVVVPGVTSGPSVSGPGTGTGNLL